MYTKFCCADAMGDRQRDGEKKAERERARKDHPRVLNKKCMQGEMNMNKCGWGGLNKVKGQMGVSDRCGSDELWILMNGVS